MRGVRLGLTAGAELGERPNCQAQLRLAPLAANGALQCNQYTSGAYQIAAGSGSLDLYRQRPLESTVFAAVAPTQPK